MEEDEKPLAHLTVCLLRQGMVKPEDVLRRASALARLDVRAGSKRLGELYVQPPRGKSPRWARLFDGHVDDIATVGRSSSTAAVWLLQVDGQSVAITFGQGRHLLVPGCWEERFGLRVALNSIPEDQLRSIDKQTFDALARHTRVQSTRSAAPHDFGVDVDQDLLRAVTGTPRDPALGVKLSGMDSLHGAARAALEDVVPLVGRYLKAYKENTYKKVFPWVDHIAAVGNKQLISDLDSLLVARIARNDLHDCWMAVPELIDWNRAVGFQYSLARRAAQYHDLNLARFVETLEGVPITLDLLRKRRARCMNDEGQVIEEWPIYRCIYAELSHGGDAYLLTGGKWYRVSKSFVDEVNDFFSRVPRYQGQLPEYDDDAEGAYCARVAQTNPEYALMDRKMIRIGGAKNQVEFCDLYSTAKDLIHIKRYGGSSPLSHLFAQGAVAGESFKGDEEFRGHVNRLLPAGHRIADISLPPATSEYQVVFAIISESNGDLTIPLFSRVTLRLVARRLIAFGYRVAIAKIIVNADRARTARLRPQA